jgi:hypothetical protein
MRRPASQNDRLWNGEGEQSRKPLLRLRRTPLPVRTPNDAMPLVDAGRLGEYLDILKRSVGRLSEHGHAD